MKKTSKYIFIIIISFLIGNKLVAQSNTLYFMDGIHQSSSLNAAYQNPCNGYLALPAISGPYIDIANTGFNFNHLFRPGTGLQADSLIIDFQNVKSKLAKSNYVLANLQVPLFGMGFWVRNSYFTFEISNKTRARVSYPENLVRLPEGNGGNIGEDNPIVINDFGPDAFNYNEFAFGLSKQITHRLIIGGKFKILAGTMAIESRESDFKLYTADVTNNHELRMETKLRLNISAPVDFAYDDDGMINDLEFDDSNITSSIASFKNMGLGIDFGASYQFNDELKFYASITDLGFIRWKNNTVNLEQDASFTFSGLTLDSVWNDNSDYDELEELADSISDQFRFSETDSKFTTFLNTNIFFGATYEVAPFMNFGILSKTFFYDRKIHQAFTLSANFKPTKWFTGSLSYSAMNREYKNIGLGMAFRAGPVQAYFVTDYINGAFGDKQIKKMKNIGAQFGINLYFGCGKRQNFSMIKNKKPQKDKDFM